MTGTKERFLHSPSLMLASKLLALSHQDGLLPAVTILLQSRCLADKGVITTTTFRKTQAKFMGCNLY